MRRLKILTDSQMKLLSTPRLIAYKNRLLRVHESPDWDCMGIQQMSKQHPQWKQCYAECKAILGARPHVRRHR